jgi:hypothetical protein
MSKSAQYYNSLKLRGVSVSTPKTKYVKESSISWERDKYIEQQTTTLKASQK